MKKVLILLLLSLFLTGCHTLNLEKSSIDTIIDTILISNNQATNVVFDGYKYYIPKGLKYVEKKDYNAVLALRDIRYYLYIDAIAYYHKANIKYQKNSEAFYYKEIINKNTQGFIEIIQEGDYYQITIVYNYGKIEVTSKEKDLNEVIADGMIILSSITFNDKVLASLIGENVLNYKEQKYTLFNTEKNQDDFLEYIEEYDTYYDYDVDIPDEDNIDINVEQ